jgi:uncharacterized protein DUF2242
MLTLKRAPLAWLSCLELLVVAVALTGCGGKKMVHEETFEPNTPFSARLEGSGDVVCWSVKHAFLNQGYMLDRSGDSVILTGTKDFQPDDDTNVTLHLQTTCVDNRDGTSTVFASATRETSKMQNVKQSFQAGVSFATVTLPAGSEKVLRVAKRETIQDPKFYDRFYALVKEFAKEEARASRTERRDSSSNLPDRRSSAK